jgi:hypothetical protein
VANKRDFLTKVTVREPTIITRKKGKNLVTYEVKRNSVKEKSIVFSS